MSFCSTRHYVVQAVAIVLFKPQAEFKKEKKIFLIAFSARNELINLLLLPFMLLECKEECHFVSRKKFFFTFFAF